MADLIDALERAILDLEQTDFEPENERRSALAAAIEALGHARRDRLKDTTTTKLRANFVSFCSRNGLTERLKRSEYWTLSICRS